MRPPGSKNPPEGQKIGKNRKKKGKKSKIRADNRKIAIVVDTFYKKRYNAIMRGESVYTGFHISRSLGGLKFVIDRSNVDR
jgi:hypothetical protein